VTANESFGNFTVGTVKNATEGGLRNLHGGSGSLMVELINIVEFKGFELVGKEIDLL